MLWRACSTDAAHSPTENEHRPRRVDRRGRCSLLVRGVHFLEPAPVEIGTRNPLRTSHGNENPTAPPPSAGWRRETWSRRRPLHAVVEESGASSRRPRLPRAAVCPRNFAVGRSRLPRQAPLWYGSGASSRIGRDGYSPSTPRNERSLPERRRGRRGSGGAAHRDRDVRRHRACPGHAVVARLDGRGNASKARGNILAFPRFASLDGHLEVPPGWVYAKAFPRFLSLNGRLGLILLWGNTLVSTYTYERESHGSAKTKKRSRVLTSSDKGVPPASEQRKAPSLLCLRHVRRRSPRRSPGLRGNASASTAWSASPRR